MDKCFLLNPNEIGKLTPDSNILVLDRIVARKIGLKKSIILSAINKIKSREEEILADSVYQLTPFFNHKTVDDTIHQLSDLGYIKIEKIVEEKKREILKSKNMNGLGIGNKRCEWCGIKTIILHNHHYPVSKNNGGIEKVYICANCHYEFHHMKEHIVITGDEKNE